MKTKLFAIILGVFLITGIVSCTKEPVSVVQTDNNTKKENTENRFIYCLCSAFWNKQIKNSSGY